MTREKQRKSTIVDNEEILNGIIKKENQVNPFLTNMNFKISYKTWLKAAKHTIRIREKKKKRKEMPAGSAYDYSTIVEEDKQKTV